jgi:hypothetical protein
MSSESLASRILQELNRTDAANSGDAHFICRLMLNIIEILSSESEFPKQANNLLSKSDFALKCLKSHRFLELLSAHIGGELDGWGAASALVFTSIQALGLCLATTTPADGRCPAAFWFLVEASSNSSSSSNCSSKVLNRVLTVASSCPSALVQQMSNGSSNNNNNNQNDFSANGESEAKCFSLQTEGEILAWKSAWESIIGFVQAVGTTEGRKFLQKKSEEIARAKALRQGAAVFVAYLKLNEAKNVAYKLMLNTARDFVENV